MSLQIFQAKPNPIGKDKTSSGHSKPAQLVGEWVDIKNIGTQPIHFSTIKLHHTLFNQQCQTTGQTDQYWSSGGTDALKPGQVLRVYTGHKRDEHLRSQIDQSGADWFAYAERDNFVLNNRCGDTIYVTWQNSQLRQQQDSASYAQNPPEGVVLKRVGSFLQAFGMRAGF